MRYLLCILIITFSLTTYGQLFSKLTIKAGNSLSGQIKIPPKEYDEYYNIDIKLGFTGTVEPTIFSFGSKKQFDFNTDISFIQKGGHCAMQTPESWGMGIGTESYTVEINYLSFSPIVKYNFCKMFFIKAGPRIDRFLSFKLKWEMGGYDPRTSKDFDPYTYGITYGIGICNGKKKVKFICELIGQNDFTNSSYNSESEQTFRNYSYLINCGVIILLKKQDK